MRSIEGSLLSLLVLGLGACDLPPSSSDPAAAPFLGDVGAALGIEPTAPLTLLGVTVDPDTGARFVLSEERGLVELVDGEARGLWHPDDLEERPFEGSLTHVASLGRGVFALTALSDGFLLDSRFGMLDRHFCYEPCFDNEGGGGDWCEGWLDPVVPLLQITHGLTYAPAANVLVAQPQSVVEDALDDPWDAYLALYDPALGTFLGWQELPFGYRSHGIAVVGDEVWMARGKELLRYALPDPAAFVSGVVEPAVLLGEVDLGAYGVVEVRGLALDEARGELLVLDGATRTLLAIDVEGLR